MTGGRLDEKSGFLEKAGCGWFLEHFLSLKHVSAQSLFIANNKNLAG